MKRFLKNSKKSMYKTLSKTVTVILKLFLSQTRHRPYRGHRPLLRNNSLTPPPVLVENINLYIPLHQKLLEAHEEQNCEAFTEAVKDFDSVSRLDQWLTTMLLRIKKTIQGDAGDLK